MLIGFSGPASTGKTGTFNAARPLVTAFAEEQGLTVHFIEERAREIYQSEFSKEFPTFEDLMDKDPLRYQLRLSEAFVDDAFSARGRNDLMISDRVGLDVLVYTQINMMRGFRDPSIETRIFKNLKATMQKVDRIFMTRPQSDAVEADGFRPSQYADQANRKYEENLFDVLGGTYPNTVWLPSTREGRVALIMATIRGLYE